MYRSAKHIWQILDGKRTGLLRRCERYAALTIPKICLPDGYDSDNTDETHDYQSIGAQSVNHLSNKLMLAMFAPSRPFVKLKAGKKMSESAGKMNLTETDLNGVLAKGEREAVSALDSMGQRPKLFSVMRHLIVTGNVLLCLEGKSLRTIGLKNFVVQRDIEGRVKHLVIREQLNFEELDPKVVGLYRARYTDGSKVEYFKWIKREPNGSYTMTQWVGADQLPKEYNGRWPEASLPYRVVTWDIADEANYGTGLVEEYVGDLEALSTLSEAVVDGAVLGTEFRFMVNPNGITQVDDLNNSKNGDALPGLSDDVSASQGGNPQAVSVALEIIERYERRVSRGFLMGSSVIRDAERVTQEEVRLTANELETAYGGVYSTLADSLQKPVAEWLFKIVGLPIVAADVAITIVTGLDALSRNGDLENFRLAMGDVGAMMSLPEPLIARTKFDQVYEFVGQGRGVDLSRFLYSDDEFKEQQAQAAASRVEETVATEAGTAAVTQGQT